MIKNTLNSSNYIHKKIFVILAILIGLVINVFLIGSVTVFKSFAAASPAKVFFSPDVVSIPPDANINVMVDPSGQTLSFVRIKVFFDFNILNLASEVNTAGTPLSQVISITPMSQANTDGRIEIVLAQKPGDTVPTTIFKLAGLVFNLAPGATSQQTTEITVVDEDTQLVDSASVEVLFTTGFVAVNSNINPTQPPINKKISDLLKGNCASELFIDTAIGCIPRYDTQALAEFFIKWGIGIAGGIAILLIVYAGFMVTTSQGDPHRLQAGKELMTAAFMGLLMLVFAAYLLRIIGVDILKIPGF